MTETGLPPGLQASDPDLAPLKSTLLTTLPALFPDTQGNGLINSADQLFVRAAVDPRPCQINTGQSWRCGGEARTPPGSRPALC